MKKRAAERRGGWTIFLESAAKRDDNEATAMNGLLPIERLKTSVKPSSETPSRPLIVPRDSHLIYLFWLLYPFKNLYLFLHECPCYVPLSTSFNSIIISFLFLIIN